jgi:hypothetical protein
MTEVNALNTERGVGTGPTLVELTSLPAVIPVNLADHILGISKSLGQRLRREGTYPVRVLALGYHHRISTADLLVYLGLRLDALTGPSEASDGTISSPSSPDGRKDRQEAAA